MVILETSEVYLNLSDWKNFVTKWLKWKQIEEVKTHSKDVFKSDALQYACSTWIVNHYGLSIS